MHHISTHQRSFGQTIALAFGALALLLAEFTVAEVTVVEPLEGENVPAVQLSADELKQLAGPVALYPDDLLAIVLPAATYPLQVVAAARFRENEANDGVEPNEDWDESIVALLNYPEALALLNDDINWTWELGQAVIAQEAELMNAIQVFRQEAYAAGNIDSDDKQNVYVKDERVIIEPVEEDVVHVPYYDTAEVIVYQPRRVYHYYPHSYPLYYYPYASYNRFYDHGFWGLSSFFTLSWAHYNLHHYSHRHHHHRYYGRHYNRHHFRHTARYHTPRYHQRRWSHRARHDYAYNGHWRPAKRHLGARPHYQTRLKRRDLAANRDLTRRDVRRQRHIERRGRHEYRALRDDRRGFGRRGLEERRATTRAANERGVRGRDHIRMRDDRPSVGGVRAGDAPRIARRDANQATERRQIRRAERNAQTNRAQRAERRQRLERRQSQARVERAQRVERTRRAEGTRRVERTQRVQRPQRVERTQRVERPRLVERNQRANAPRQVQRAQRPERRQIQQRVQRSPRAERPHRTQQARNDGRREIRANRGDRQARSGGGRFREHTR